MKGKRKVETTAPENSWTPNLRIRHQGETVPVMLVGERLGFTWADWYHGQASYKRDGSRWYLKGEEINGAEILPP